MNRAQRRRKERNRPMEQSNDVAPTPADRRPQLSSVRPAAPALPLGRVVHKRRPVRISSTTHEWTWCGYALDTLSQAELWSDVDCHECRDVYTKSFGHPPVDTPVPSTPAGPPPPWQPLVVALPLDMAVALIRDFFAFAEISDEVLAHAGHGTGAIEYWIQEYVNARRPAAVPPS